MFRGGDGEGLKNLKQQKLKRRVLSKESQELILKKVEILKKI